MVNRHSAYIHDNNIKCEKTSGMDIIKMIYGKTLRFFYVIFESDEIK